MVNENPQDSVPDFEPETDFSEFEDEKNESSLSATLKNSPLIKLGLIAAGLIIVVGGIVLLGGKEEKAPLLKQSYGKLYESGTQEFASFG